jgi:hypothetical protein
VKFEVGPKWTVPTGAKLVCASPTLGASRIHSAEEREELYVTCLLQFQWPAFVIEIIQLLLPALRTATEIRSPGLILHPRSPLQL